MPAIARACRSSSSAPGIRPVAEKRVATIQTIGGTGAVGIAADFLAKHCPGRSVLVSDPTWENHHGLFQRAGFKTTTYPYWDRANRRSISTAW